MSLNEMTDEQVLDAWHAATMAQRCAVTDDSTVRMAMRPKAETDAIRRFGLGEHLKAHRTRFPEERS